jgi:PEP-CTERM motif
MTLRFQTLSMTAFLIATATSAVADPTVVKSVFATGASVGGTQPDSITTGDGSVWVEYGNGADSTGASGSSTIEQYSVSGALQHTYTISGLVDGLKVNPVTGMVWALQNNDGNSTLSLINPTTQTVSGPLSYASPPYVYGPTSGRGYDDVAFLNGNVYLSYSNPVNPTDPVLQKLNQGNNPSGTLTTTDILTAQQTGQLMPDIDSLKSTWNGDLVLTSEGDGPGTGNPVGEFTLISHPGAVNQTVTNVPVTDAKGDNVIGMDDVLFPSRSAGTLYVTDTGANKVYALSLTGLDPNTPIISLGDLGGLDEVAAVNPVTGVVETTLLTGVSVHGLDFVAAPEPATWAMILLGFAGLGFTARRASVRRAAAAG